MTVPTPNVPTPKFSLRGVEVRVNGVRQYVPLKLESISNKIKVDSDEPGRRLELLHEYVKNYSTDLNTVALGTTLSGVLRHIQVDGHIRLPGLFLLARQCTDPTISLQTEDELIGVSKGKRLASVLVASVLARDFGHSERLE